MSGPKISVYELSPWQRKNMLEQLKCTQNSFACVEQIKQMISGLNGLGGQAEALLGALSLVNARTGENADDIYALHRMQSDLTQACVAYMKELRANMPVVTDKIMLSEDALNAKKALFEKLKALQKKITAHRGQIEQTLSETDQKAKSGISEIKSGIADDIAAVSSFYIEPDNDSEDSFSETHKSLEDKLRTLFLSSECPPSMKKELIEAVSVLAKITDVAYLDTFIALTISPMLKKYYEELAKQSKDNSYEELKSQYTALCAIARVKEKAFVEDNAITELLMTEIAALEKQIVAQTEQEYISDCVNEVMVEMGYDLIGNRSVTKRSGKRFRNELFSYNDGTAINVTYDSEGQIAMELGGIDRTDRIPTPDEADTLCDDMKSFCNDFKSFEEKLNAKGISVRSRVSMSPPAVEYAAIINVDDYNITMAKPVSDMKIKNKRKKSNAKQTLRREGD